MCSDVLGVRSRGELDKFVFESIWLVYPGLAGPDWKLTVTDNGIGKPDVSASTTKPGLGTSLVKALTRQLDAVVDIASDSRGTAVSVTHATFKSKPLKTSEMLLA